MLRGNPNAGVVPGRTVFWGATMTPRHIAAAAAICLMSICGLSATLVQQRMIGKINERLVRDQQIEPFWFTWSKNRRILREYRRMYPLGRLATFYMVLVAAAFVLLFLCAWGIGNFG
jgi:hypothetical protein